MKNFIPLGVVLLSVGLGIGIITWSKHNGNSLTVSSADYRYIPPQWITYRQIKLLEVDVHAPACFAVIDKTSFVVGEEQPPALLFFDFNGHIVQRVPLSDKPTAVNYRNEKLTAVFADSIGIYTADGKLEKTFPLENKDMDIRSIVCTDDAVFLADTAAKRIYKYDHNGQQIKTFGEPVVADDETQFDGFRIYLSPITMTLSPKTGLLHITNPGLHRIETFTPDGIYEPALSWGYASGDLGGFAGCCNPVSLTSLDDGRIVTAEKGVSRVKIYRTDRSLDCVVAGPGVLDRYPRSVSPRPKIKPNDRNFAVSVIPNGQIAVFDYNWKLLRIMSCE
ncbi:hypothetical protein FACS1894170_10390 [Planctomycetales bacterium]|nr:hypothetical protein FACS1894170_10390 [Planctomycetales bacterium]